jgi:hypothetical protein
MKRRPVYQTALILCMLAGFFFLFFGNTAIPIKVDEAYVQRMVNQHLPVTKHGITVETGTVKLDNSLDITLAVSGSKFTRKFSMIIHAVGQPDFEHSRGGEVFFKPSKVEVLDPHFSGVQPHVILDHLRDKYIHNDTVKQALTDISPNVEGWMIDAAQDSAMIALEHVPVFRLEGHWYQFAGGAVKTLSVQGNYIVGEIPIWTIGFGVLVGIVIVLGAICFLIFIACNPEVGLVLMLFD